MKNSEDSEPRVRLKKFRERVHSSQRDLAKVFSVAPGAIAMWESGQREMPGPAVALLERLEAEFGGLNDSSLDASLTDSHLSEKFTELLLVNTGLPNANPSGIPEPKNQKTKIRSAIRELVENYLSRIPGTRQIQVALIERAFDTVANAKGLPLKIIQLASFIDFGLSHSTRQTLIEVQSSLAPLPARKVREVFQEEFGRAPEDVFAHWNPRPVAMASIGQVHEAWLHSGERVAVKVQYPNIYRSIVLQTQLFKTLSQLMALVRTDYADTLQNFTKKLREECDYSVEADNHAKFYRAFHGDADIVIPRVYTDYSTPRIFTTEYIEGKGFHEFLRTSTQEERDRAGLLIHRFHYEATMLHGILQADPHPGNYIFVGGKIAFIDFGRIVGFEPQNLDKTKKFYKAIQANDPLATRAAMVESNYVRNWNRFDFEEFWTVLTTQMHYELSDKPVKFSQDYVRRIWKLANSFRHRSQLTMNSEFFWPVFASANLWSVLADLEAEAHWRSNVVRALDLK